MSRTLTDRILDWLFPPVCAFCGRPSGASHYCGCRLPVMKPRDMQSALHELTFSDGYASPLFYVKGTRTAILGLKSRHCGDNAGVLARMLAEACENARFGHIDAVTCIPSSRGSMEERGYNPAGLIAEKLADELGLPFEETLRCTKRVTRQKTKTAAERAAGVEGAFSATAADLSGMSLLLVDDVMTTGSTLNEASRTLRLCGAEKVFCAAAATTAKKYRKGE